MNDQTGKLVYENRAVLFARVVWGKIVYRRTSKTRARRRPSTDTSQPGALVSSGRGPPEALTGLQPFTPPIVGPISNTPGPRASQSVKGALARLFPSAPAGSV